MYRPLYDTEEIPLVKIATDDAHRPPHFGRAWIEGEASRDRDAIIARSAPATFASASRSPERRGSDGQRRGVDSHDETARRASLQLPGILRFESGMAGASPRRFASVQWQIC